MSGRLPWAKWSFSDWARDPALRSVGYAAKGLWADMLAAMDASPQIGYLVVGDAAASTTQIARIVGGDKRTVARLIDELEAAGVFSRDERGAIFNRRMVRENDRHERSVENGKRGGNPILTGAARASVQQNDAGMRQDDAAVQQDDARMRQTAPQETSDNNDVDTKEVISPLKTDKDLDKDKEKKENKKDTPPSEQNLASPDGDEFDRWWRAYPKRVGKGGAKKAYAKARKSASAAQLLAALNRTWSKDERFILHPTTWLNNEHWLDEIEEPWDPVLKAAGLDRNGKLLRPTAPATPATRNLRLVSE